MVRAPARSAGIWAMLRPRLAAMSVLASSIKRWLRAKDESPGGEGQGDFFRPMLEAQLR